MVRKDSQQESDKVSKWLFKSEYQNKIVSIIEGKGPLPEITSNIDQESVVEVEVKRNS